MIFFKQGKKKKREIPINNENSRKRQFLAVVVTLCQFEANFYFYCCRYLTDDMIGFQTRFNFSHCTPQGGAAAPDPYEEVRQICNLLFQSRNALYNKRGGIAAKQKFQVFSINERHYCQFSVSLTSAVCTTPHISVSFSEQFL